MYVYINEFGYRYKQEVKIAIPGYFYTCIVSIDRIFSARAPIRILFLVLRA